MSLTATDSFDPQLGLLGWLVPRQIGEYPYDCQTITRKKFNDIILIGRKRLKSCKEFFNLFFCVDYVWRIINSYYNVRIDNH